MPTKKQSVFRWGTLALALAAMLAVKLLPPPAGLTEAGFQIIGILFVAILLFLTHGTGWPSMFVVFLLMTVPGLSVAQVTTATFGNNTAIFLLFCFMLAACLTESGVIRRIAIWFLTNRLSRKSPWWTIAMYFAAVYVLDLFLSAATCIMILLPILLSIFESVRLQRDDQSPLATMLLLCTVVVAQLANGSNPISHAVTIQGFSLYESYVGEPLDFFNFCVIATPVSIVSVLVVFLLVKLVWRPDVSPFAAIDYDAMQATCGPVTKKERLSVLFYLLCVLFWLLPGLSKFCWPSAYPLLSRINNCYPPLIALFLMSFLRVDGEPILEWNTALRAVNWPTFLFIASIMGLGSFMGNSEIGISEWLSGLLAPVFVNVSPLVFLLVMVLIVDVLTNFCSNSVALSVVIAIALPICMSVYSGALSPMLTTILITSSSQNGWATAPATPTAAVAYASGWGNQRVILKWGLFIMLIQSLICLLVGLPLAELLGI